VFGVEPRSPEDDDEDDKGDSARYDDDDEGEDLALKIGHAGSTVRRKLGDTTEDCLISCLDHNTLEIIRPKTDAE